MYLTGNKNSLFLSTAQLSENELCVKISTATWIFDRWMLLKELSYHLNSTV